MNGADEVARNMRALAGRYGKAVGDAIVAGGQDVRNTAIRSIQEKSPGREVTRYRQGGAEYQTIAASEGFAPNTDTGRLANSVQLEIERDGVFVGNTLEYAGPLEFGTANMGARPWLNPALEENRRKIFERVVKAAKQVSKRHGDV